MPDSVFEFTGGLPLIPCELANKHKVTLPVKALVDTSLTKSKISFRIWSALGFDMVESGLADSYDQPVGKKCIAWCLFHSGNKTHEIKSEFEIHHFNDVYDLSLGLDLLRTHFDFTIKNESEFFVMHFKE